MKIGRIKNDENEYNIVHKKLTIKILEEALQKLTLSNPLYRNYMLYNSNLSSYTNSYNSNENRTEELQTH